MTITECQWGDEVFGPHPLECTCGECCRTCGAQPGWPCADGCAYAAYCADTEREHVPFIDMSEATSPAGWRHP